MLCRIPGGREIVVEQRKQKIDLPEDGDTCSNGSLLLRQPGAVRRSVCTSHVTAVPVISRRPWGPAPRVEPDTRRTNRTNEGRSLHGFRLYDIAVGQKYGE
jgi:hypothetical protein